MRQVTELHRASHVSSQRVPSHACTVSFAAAATLRSHRLSRAVHRSAGPGKLSGEGRADSVARLKAAAKHLRPRHAYVCASPTGPRRAAACTVTTLRSS